MHRRTYSEAGDISSPRSSRAASFTSERPSVSGSVTFQMPSSVRPQPAYIAASVASEIVTDHINTQLGKDNVEDADDGTPFVGNALFSEQALRLLNGFLDHLLFAFLSSARSPSLTAIRPAITDVLKSRLAREAFVTADDELQGLLAGEDEEEFPAAQDGRLADKWDVEKVWKRTRLRIMVYTRLGELEDEDEERYVQQERGLSMDESDDDEAGLVSWASAIFLTSVVEYVAEQTLVVSGQAAYARTTARMRKLALNTQEGADAQLERIIVEDHDVEKLALNSTLGRLWRTWRKRVRAPASPISPEHKPRYISSMSSLHRRGISHEAADESMLGDGVPELPEHEPTETEIAANIPLPMTENDVAEIEVPGLARQWDEEGSGTETPVTRPNRPSSVIQLAPAESFKRRLARERPVSLPPPAAGAFTVPVQSDIPDDREFVTPFERMSDDGDSYIFDEEQEGVHHEDPTVPEHRKSVAPDPEHDADMVAFAASTGMGFGMGPDLPISPTKSSVTDKEDEDTITTPTRAGFDEPQVQVRESKRMSFERSGPPSIVRTFSSRSQRSSLASPSLASPLGEGRTYLDDPQSDEDVGGHGAIGVAQTSNVAIPATPTPPVESTTNEQSTGYIRHGERAVADQIASRRLAMPSATARQTPSPLDQMVPPERSIARKQISPSKSRGPATQPVHDPADLASRPLERATPEQQLRDSPRNVSVRSSPGQDLSRYREVPSAAAVAAAAAAAAAASGGSMQSKSAESSPRSRMVHPDGIPVEKAPLKRVSSSSSTNRSVGTSILHTGRESETSISRPRGLSGRMSEEDREREFDTLVKSDDTVKYTLTPQNMRDIDEPSAVRKVDSHKPASSVTVYPQVSAEQTNSFGAQPMPTRTSSRNGASASRKFTGLKPLAREPRIQTESMRDFADFIRSTGPIAGEESRPVQPFVSLSDAKTPNGSSTAISGLGRKLSTKQSTNKSQSTSSLGEGPSARNRTQMEPRSPAGQRSGNDDLIDFIRQGPPGANNGQPRIPRSVAPFRTTVDSDQFERMLDDNNNIESAYSSQVSTVSKQSNHTANSKTGLLATPNVVQPAYSNTPQKLSGSLSSPEPQIKRTRRRVKDPYAIDTDDEDEDLLTALPKSAKPRQEESLLDFLNSQEPTTDSAPQPFLLNGATVAAAKARMANQQTASSNGSTSSSSNRTNLPQNSANSRKPARNQNQPPIFSTTIRSEAPRAHKPKLQARDPTPTARTGRSATTDLADFLRTSGPPESAPPPGATIKKEEKSGGRKFWRKKTYPDMP